MEPNLHHVSDLPQAARDALAMASGLPLQAREQFYVVVLNNIDEQLRDRAWAEMQRIAATAQQNVAHSGIKPEDFEALVDEICHEVRHGRLK
jgi:hypothetical protein